MSRSYKHTSITGNTKAKSEKKDKQSANRKLRHLSNRLVSDEDCITPVVKEVSNVWSFEKDGKHYFSKKNTFYSRLMRK